MPEPRDLKGKFFNYKLDPGGTLPEDYDGGVKHNSATNVITHLRDAPRGAQGQTWSFRFLKYWAGAITRTGLEGPVLTGPMSGCILCRYTKDARSWVAHIGTANDPTSQGTVNVKNAWTAFMANGVSNLVGRKPTQVINDIDVTAYFKLAPQTIPQVWGYFTPNDAWALLIRSTNVASQPSNEILLVRPMVLLPWNQIPGSW